MRKATYLKFSNYQLNPDLANKFLVKTKSEIPNFKITAIYLKFTFRQKTPYSFIALKALLMLSSISTKIPVTNTKIVILKFTKKQSHSIVFLSLNFLELIHILTLYYIKPAPIKKVMTSDLREKKYFLFPGFIKHLRIPSWKRNLNIGYHSENKKNTYWLFFYKTIFFD